ncbi:hypothetical protein TIFTF001_048008 [Ficus carica]|uniref:C-JID domain-containing protein n=1 Tax=Ficus carica TaxID=3494 RepID=A0AA87Z546_FICCA|nr:hypothetical protein TIFTF001_048008 [Ficus carica]
MHDLLQDFGQNIVRQQSKERLGKRSRLCTAEDAYRVLNNNEGTEKIEGIFLNNCSKIKEVLRLGPEVFHNMCNLRLLEIHTSVQFLSQDLQYLPHSLRYIYWLGYPSKCFPSNFVPSNLVELHLPFSELEQLWDGVQDLDKLKCINLSVSGNLKEIPDLSRAPNLERIYLKRCGNLVKVPWNTLRSDKLIELNLWGCERASSTLPEGIFKTSTLKTLILYGSKVKILPETISPGLVSLNLVSSGIQSLPSSIGSLENLYELILYNCKSLSNIPNSIHKLKYLKYLGLAQCCSLDEFRVQLPRNLETLDLKCTAIKEIPSSSFENCSGLQKIKLKSCKMIESLPSNIFELRSLRVLNLDYCSNLKSLPEISKPIESLEDLRITCTGIRQLPSSIENLIGIEELNLENCANLESIPDSIYNLTRLRSLVLWNCKNLRSIPELPLSLNALNASGCTSLERVSSSKRVLRQWFRAPHRLTLDDQNFSECLKMDQNSQDEILSDYQLRVLAKARQHELHRRDDSTVVCYPGNEIPKWFDYQSDGSSHTVALTPQWHNADFLGFVFCIVIDGKAYREFLIDMGSLGLKCKFNFKIRDTGEVHSFDWEDYNACHDAVEVSLEFSFVNRIIFLVRSSTEVVKRCGIHMLYRDDLKDMEIDYECDVESDATHEDEPSEDESIDADERRLKKIKHSN